MIKKQRKKGSGGKRKGAGRETNYGFQLDKTISIRTAEPLKEELERHLKAKAHRYHLKHKKKGII